jgi:hypothetical protein
VSEVNKVVVGYSKQTGEISLINVDTKESWAVDRNALVMLSQMILDMLEEEIEVEQ